MMNQYKTTSVITIALIAASMMMATVGVLGIQQVQAKPQFCFDYTDSEGNLLHSCYPSHKECSNDASRFADATRCKAD